MNNVQQFRESANLSQKALGDICGCSQPTIAAIEAGGKTNVHLAQRIAAALGRSVGDTFPLDPETPNPNPEPRTAMQEVG